MRMHSELRLEQPRRSELGEALLVVSQLSMTRVGIRAANEIGPRRMITVRVAAIWCEQRVISSDLEAGNCCACMSLALYEEGQQQQVAAHTPPRRIRS